MNIVSYMKPYVNEDQMGTNIDEVEKGSIEIALQLKEALGGEVIALTVGEKPAEEILREAFAMGVDQAVMIEEIEENEDNVAKALKKIGYDVVVSSSELGKTVAEKLNIPYIEYNEEVIKEINSKLPCVLSTTATKIKARYMQISGVFSAYEKIIKQEQL
ncbi:MAG: electron transfer flavoprotein subunit beta/FixA family protein [Firmicutes bacterium]|nr:electron transfer flavoprotein subunit beta/FixA family protein [Bacillota bacterium]